MVTEIAVDAEHVEVRQAPIRDMAGGTAGTGEKFPPALKSDISTAFKRLGERAQVGGDEIDIVSGQLGGNAVAIGIIEAASGGITADTWIWYRAHEERTASIVFWHGKTAAVIFDQVRIIDFQTRMGSERADDEASQAGRRSWVFAVIRAPAERATRDAVAGNARIGERARCRYSTSIRCNVPDPHAGIQCWLLGGEIASEIEGSSGAITIGIDHGASTLGFGGLNPSITVAIDLRQELDGDGATKLFRQSGAKKMRGVATGWATAANGGSGSRFAVRHVVAYAARLRLSSAHGGVLRASGAFLWSELADEQDASEIGSLLRMLGDELFDLSAAVERSWRFGDLYRHHPGTSYQSEPEDYGEGAVQHAGPLSSPRRTSHRAGCARPRRMSRLVTGTSKRTDAPGARWSRGLAAAT